MSELLCKGGCGNSATYKGWCKIKWKSGNKFGVACPIVESKRRGAISKFRINEAKEGKNPMQNPIICTKNHSEERNRKCSEILKRKGRLKLLPQQKESEMLKAKRRKNVALSLKKLWEEGRHPRQLESSEKRKERLNKMAETLKKLGEQGKLPVQNMTQDQKEKFCSKISKALREGLKSGKIQLSPGWKKVPYKGLVLRSYWERIMANFLDKYDFDWTYETLRLDYWDSERKVKAITIPDFYIFSLNMVIEVKSNGEYRSQKTKDKTEAIRKKGFNFILVGKKEIDLIKNDETKFLDLIKRGVQG